jgi:hypothetical protein
MRIYVVMLLTNTACIPLTCHVSLCVSMSAEQQSRKVYLLLSFKRFRVRVSVSYILKAVSHGFPHPAHTKICLRQYRRLINPSTVSWLRRLEAGLSPLRHVSTPGQSMWHLWWTYWHWDKFRYEYFHFPLKVSLHQCSIVTFLSSTTEAV